MEPFVQSYQKILQIKNGIALFYGEQFGDSHDLTKLTMKIASLWNVVCQIAGNYQSINNELRATIMHIPECERELYAVIEKSFLLT